MATDNLFNKSADEIIKGSNTIHITQKTIRFGSDIYQFKNITGFGMTVIKKSPIPLEVVIGTVVVGGFLLITGVNFRSGSSALWGLGLLFLALIMIWINQSPNKIYGLKLYLPCVENKVFLSNDVHGIHDIIALLYEFMEKENNPNAVATITIDQRHARIGIGYAENVNSREN